MANRRTRRRRPLAIDLFCGAGGMSLGFEQAGFDIVLAVDSDGHHVATHARNFPRCRVLCQSVAQLTASDLYTAIGQECEIDLIFGGPPCQGFSNMGLRDTLDPRNNLVDQFARIVSEVRPRAFVMENVPGLLAGEARQFLDRVVASFEGAGYRIACPIRTLDASDFGVPERRKRLFLLGLRADAGAVPAYPAGRPTGQPPRPTVWEAIADLPDVENRPELFDEDEAEYRGEAASLYVRVARGLANDPSDFSYPRIAPSRKCMGCLRVRHTPATIALYTATRPGEMVPGHKLPRLDPDGVCPTLRAGSDSTHGSYTAPRPIHPVAPRCITAREAARLHGYPDWFAFYPSKWHAYRQIGNSVCPPVARAVGSTILEALDIVPVKSTKAITLGHDFPLPQDRPRTLRRIPHAEHYPPVVAHLFGRSFDEARGRLWRDRFTFADVEDAIAATGVTLPWVRSDNFIAELARSRNLATILEPCKSRGFTLQAILDGKFIGAFVPAGSPGSVEDKSEAGIRRADLVSAIALNRFTAADAISPQSLPLLLKDRQVVESLWGEKGAALRLTWSGDLFGGKIVTGYRLRPKRGAVRRGGVFVAVNGTLPSRVRIGRLASAGRDDEMVALARLTDRHVVAALYAGGVGLPEEIRRQVYELSPG